MKGHLCDSKDAWTTNKRFEMKLQLASIGKGRSGDKDRKAFVRRSGRIAKSSLRRFKNTVEDPICLDTEEKINNVSTESDSISPQALDFSDTDEDERLLSSMIKNPEKNEIVVTEKRMKKNHSRVGSKSKGSNTKRSKPENNLEDSKKRKTEIVEVESSKKKRKMNTDVADKNVDDILMKSVIKNSEDIGKQLDGVERSKKKRKKKGNDSNTKSKRKQVVGRLEDSERSRSGKKQKIEAARLKKGSKQDIAGKFISLKTRSSPLQFFKCVENLKDGQKDAVKKMGFGGLLTWKVDGVPGMLGHYVVDRFRPKTMRIKIPKHKIKINSEAIQKLLGVPCGEVEISSLTRLKKRDPVVMAWRERYPDKFVAPTQLVEKIQSSEDEDNFNFRMDFLMLFLTVLVECHGQGRLKETILRYITVDTDFSNINWCAYIVNAMKGCKKLWKREDPDSQFAGPLAILTLLYVDSFVCKGVPVDSKTNAITFWTMKKLKERQSWEIKKGAFGQGKYKGLSTIVQPAGDAINLPMEISQLGMMYETYCKQKSCLEKKFEKLLKGYPENEEVQLMKAKYLSIMKNVPAWAEEQIDKFQKASDTIRVVLEDLSIGNINVESEQNASLGNSGDAEGATEKGNNTINDDTEVGFYGADTDSIVNAEFCCYFRGQAAGADAVKRVSYDGPSFSLGLSQVEAAVVENVEGRFVEVGGTVDNVEGGQKTTTPTRSADGKEMAEDECSKLVREECEYTGQTFSLGVSQIEVKDVGDAKSQAAGVMHEVEVKSFDDLEGEGRELNTVCDEKGAEEMDENVRTDPYDGGVPNFILGVSQIEVSNGGHSKTDQNKEKGDESEVKNYDDLETERRQKMIQAIEEKRKNPAREIGVAGVNKSPYVVRCVDLAEGVTKEEEHIWDYLFAEENRCMEKGKGIAKEGKSEDIRDIVFKSSNHLELEKTHLKTLRADTKLDELVIAAWAVVLNHQEKFRAFASPRRLFCGTKLIKDCILNDDKYDANQRLKIFTENMNVEVGCRLGIFDLRGIDMVLIPVKEYGEYYLIIFELKYPAITVIDNFSESVALVHLKDHEDYFQKDSAYKLKDMFVRYLKQVQHPKTDEMHAVKIQKLKIAWATAANELDCPVFLMRHMEQYMGYSLRFNCGFSSNGMRKRTQLRDLRKKIATKIVMSDVNLLKDMVKAEALGK